MRQLMDMMMHIADTNAEELASRRRSRFHTPVMTQAQIEEQEWEELFARVERQRDVLDVEETLDAPDEDDADALMEVLEILARANGPLTVFEITQRLQHAEVLSLEFTAAARQQAMAFLVKLRDINRVESDRHGRWGLVSIGANVRRCTA